MTRRRDSECRAQDRFDDQSSGKGWHRGTLSPGLSLRFVLLMIFALVILGCSAPDNQSELIVTPEPTAAVADGVPVNEATTSPTAPAPASEAEAEDESPAEPTPDAPLGLASGRDALAAILCTDKGLTATQGTFEGAPLAVCFANDDSIVFEFIGSPDDLVTVSVAVLYSPEQSRSLERVEQALYSLIQTALPDGEWGRAWLDERWEEVLLGTPFSGIHKGHYVQVFHLREPEPFIALSVTLAPQTLSFPSFDRSALSAQQGTVDLSWDKLPLMPQALRGQALPVDHLDLYELATDASPDEVEAFYEQEMRAQGWTPDTRDLLADPATPGQQQIVLTYRRNGEGALISIDRYPGLDETVVTLGYAEDAAELPSVAG